MNEPNNPILDYRPPDGAEGATLVRQAIIAAIFTFLLSIVAVPLGMFLMYTLSSSSNSSPVLINIICIAVAAAIVAAGIWISIRFYRQPSKRGLGIGIWIGLGVAMLVEGSCFIMMH